MIERFENWKIGKLASVIVYWEMTIWSPIDRACEKHRELFLKNPIPEPRPLVFLTILAKM
jgi:hypothetical protein